MTYAEFEQQFIDKVEEMMSKDPATTDVVNTMRRGHRSWARIFSCFQKHMESLGIDTSVSQPE